VCCLWAWFLVVAVEGGSGGTECVGLIGCGLGELGFF